MEPIYLYRNEVEPTVVRIDRFPRLPRANTTLAIHTANFVGTVTTEATIKLAPTDDDWFTVHEERFEEFSTKDERRRNRAANITGCFISMRVKIVGDPLHPRGIVDRVTVI